VRHGHALLFARKIQRATGNVFFVRNRHARGQGNDGIHVAGIVQIVGGDE